jgi:quercetin dioxygenase-like cupin family protein
MAIKRWDDFPLEVMNSRISRRVWHGENMTIAQILLQEGAEVPWHSHRHEQTTSVQSGRLLFRAGQEEHVLEAGSMLCIPPDVPHQVIALSDTVAIDVFAPVRDDWQRGEDAYLRGE